MRANDKACRLRIPTAKAVVVVACTVAFIPLGSASADPDLDAALRVFGGQQQRREESRPVPSDVLTRAPAGSAGDLEPAVFLQKLREGGLGAEAASDFARQSIRRTTEITNAALVDYDRIAFSATLQASAAAVDLLLKSLAPESTVPVSPESR